MEDFNLLKVAKKSMGGFFALTTRTFFIQILSIFSSFLLTIFLTRETYGEYFIASSVVVFLNYFQDIGLAGSLIQKKEKLTLDELRTTFTVQQGLVILLIIIFLIFSPSIVHFYHLDSSGQFLFYALLIAFFLSSLKTIPTVILERNLDFKKLIIPEIIEAVLYNSVVIILAIAGFGINSFTIAILLRSIVGLIAIYVVQPWKIGIAFNINILKSLAHFGIPFQANSILALFKDNLIILYIGKMLPYSEVGLIGFAEKLAFLPLRLIMDNVIKVTFPSYSRLQHDSASLKVVIEKSLFLVSLFIFPVAVCIMLFAHDFIHYIPIARYHKWEPATVAIAFFSLNALIASLTVPITNMLNAIGKVKISLYFMILLTVVMWIATPLSIKFFGYNGVPFASALVACCLLFVIPFVKKEVKFSFINSIKKQLLAALLLACFILLTRSIVTSFPMLIMEAFVAVIFYILMIYILAKNELMKTMSFLLASIREK